MVWVASGHSRIRTGANMHASEDIYLFEHAITRQGAYDLIPPSLRVRLHLLVADLLEEAAGAQPEAVLDASAHMRQAVRWSADPAPLAAREADLCERAATHLTARHQLARAQELLEHVEHNKHTDRSVRLRAATGIASLCQMQGRISEAEELASRALLLADEEGASLEARAKLYSLRAICAWHRRRESDALAWLDRTLDLWGQAGNADGVAAAHINIGTLHRDSGRMEAAGESYRLAREAAARGSSSEVLQGIEQNDAERLRRLGRLSEAVERIRTGMQLAQQSGNLRRQAACSISLALMLQFAGKLEEAALEYAEAARLAVAGGDRVNHAIAIGNLAGALTELRRLGDAEVNCRRAIELSRELGDIGALGHWTGTLGWIQESQGNLDGAEREFREAMRISGECGEVGYKAHWGSRVGGVYRKRGEFVEAERWMREAIVRSEQAGDRGIEAHALANLAELTSEIPDAAPAALDEAVGYIERAIAVQRGAGNASTVAAHTAILAALHARRGERDTAARLFDESTGHLRACGNSEELARAEGARARWLS